MLGSLSQMYPSDGSSPNWLSIAQSNLSSLKIGWSADTQEDGTYYYLSFALPNGNGGTYLVGHN